MLKRHWKTHFSWAKTSTTQQDVKRSLSATEIFYRIELDVGITNSQALFMCNCVSKIRKMLRQLPKFGSRSSNSRDLKKSQVVEAMNDSARQSPYFIEFPAYLKYMILCTFQYKMVGNWFGIFQFYSILHSIPTDHATNTTLHDWHSSSFCKGMSGVLHTVG